jgi:hypothetical protein
VNTNLVHPRHEIAPPYNAIPSENVDESSVNSVHALEDRFSIPIKPPYSLPLPFLNVFDVDVT